MVFRIPVSFPLVLAFSFLQAGPVLAESVYWNFGIAAVQTGWSEQNNGPMGLKTHLVGIGPDNAPPALQNCIREATTAAATSTQRPLDTAIQDRSMVFARLAAGPTPPSKEIFDRETKVQTDATGQLMDGVLQHYQATVANCMDGRPFDPGAIRLGLVTRVCASWLDTVQPCMNARDPVPRSEDQKPGRFAKVHDWLEAIGLSPPVNEMIQLVPPGETLVSISPDLRDRTYFPALTAEQAQFYFEAGLARLRQRGWKYDYAGLKPAGIDQAVALALIDRIDSPALALGGLKNEGRTLQVASSEIFRTRIRECALFRGKIGDAEIAACAGVGPEADVIRSCLSGGECRPIVAAQAAGAALTITNAEGNLSLSSPLPRILSSVPLPEQLAAARTCAEQFNTKDDFIFCFTQSQLGDTRSKAALTCVQVANEDEKMNCMLDAIGGEEVAKAKCFLEARDNAARAACVISTDAPVEVAQAVECANRPAATYESIATCVVSKNIPGDAGRLVECAGSAGGNAFGAAICLAGDDLTAEQRILLQCAAQSVDPSSYGACVGGQLLLKEYVNCQDRSFAEGPCFGENNEIRKFIRNIGLGDISENTVVADLLNVPLEAVKFGVSAVEGVANAVGDLAEGVAEGLNDIFTGLVDSVAGSPSGRASVMACASSDPICQMWADLAKGSAGKVFVEWNSPVATLSIGAGRTFTLSASSMEAIPETNEEITPSQELQQLAETITAPVEVVVNGGIAEARSSAQAEAASMAVSPAWVEITPAGMGETARVFEFDMEASSSTNEVARAIGMQEVNYNALEALNFDRSALEQIRQFDRVGGFGQ